MTRDIPKNLEYFFKSALDDSDDGYEYASELHRLLNSDTCQLLLSSMEIEKLREFAEKIKTFGEINYYTKNKIENLEKKIFGLEGISGFLKLNDESNTFKSFDDLFNF